MAFSKLKNKLLICLCCFVIILPFYLITLSYASEIEDVTLTVVPNLAISNSSNFFYTSSVHSVYYSVIEKGYIYHLKNTSTTYSKYIAFSNEIAAANVPYYDFYYIAPNDTYNFISNDYDYLYINGMDDYILTREKIPGMDSAVGDLVSNVGISSIWNIFDISINYIVVVVLFAFGCYIIFRIIKKLSRGKEGL